MPFYCPTKTSAKSCNCSSMKTCSAVKDLHGSTHFHVLLYTQTLLHGTTDDRSTNILSFGLHKKAYATTPELFLRETGEELH